MMTFKKLLMKSKIKKTFVLAYRMTLLFALLAVSFSTTSASGHPVIYKGGTLIDTELNPKMSSLIVAHTFAHRFAVATQYMKFLDQDHDLTNEFYFAKLNYRLFRQNKMDSQSNVYLSLGAGQRRYDNNLSFSAIGEIHADWEDRDYYVSGFHKYLTQDNDQTNNYPITMSRFRAGLSPFRADFEDINIWFITQFDRKNGENWETTPLMRTYYKTVLYEFGASFNGNYQLNLMFHL